MTDEILEDRLKDIEEIRKDLWSLNLNFIKLNKELELVLDATPYDELNEKQKKIFVKKLQELIKKYPAYGTIKNYVDR